MDLKERIAKLKLHLGQELFLEPTGNNARYSTGIKTVTVSAVGRKFITIATEGRDHHWKYRVNNNRDHISSEGDYNSGYNYYFSKEELEERKLTRVLGGKISEKCRVVGGLYDVSLTNLKQIADLLGLEIEV